MLHVHMLIALGTLVNIMNTEIINIRTNMVFMITQFLNNLM